MVIYGLTDRSFIANKFPRANLRLSPPMNALKRTIIFACEYAFRIGVKRHGSEQAMRAAVLEADRKKQEKYEKQLNEWNIKMAESGGDKDQDPDEESQQGDGKAQGNKRKGKVIAKKPAIDSPKQPKLSNKYEISLSVDVKERVSVKVKSV